ncbi:PEP/pyruvate-binding domain-containing protein [Geodermatophilus sabuli]|uniref:Phosphoenolpyruvate synthase n=1 Tax=Geodermatophilus sabuli TaxID=1564158 RepID=A0A285EK68_9ACTN|nr:PEP/pyruvate-binding domain-containing protein [Geodermatophilus sabuli]MBB3087056.1 pyruvate,water dikinase [Geodermatophilus sabuli]SNX99397.1 pyruvate, water dikinase [Geodermatophilus sabuli]
MSTTTPAPYVLWIDDPAANGNRQLGGKFGSLAEMTAAGFAVPPGFGITTSAYRHFLESAGLAERAREVRAAARGADLARVQAISAEFSAVIEAAALPADLEAAIRVGYAELERRTGQADLPVAVRSSGESEDLAGASFAGQYDTFLWIRGAEDLLRHVRRCWAGMFGAAVLTYRPDSDPDAVLADHGICVGVQQMVEARAAGVMFTLDPVSGDRSKVVVEGCWGLGEGVVSGGITPSRYVVDKVTFEVVRRDVVRQEEQYSVDPATAAVGLVPVPVERCDVACLDDVQIDALAKLAKRIEQHRGAPQDIEWAVSEAGDVHVLQVRPETVWSARAAAPLVTEKKSAVNHVLARFAGVGVAQGRGRTS